MIKFLKWCVIIAVAIALFMAARPIITNTLYPLKYEDTIHKCAEKYNLDPYFVMGVISAESRFSEEAVSHKNAKGLMQLTDNTAKWCAEKFSINGDIYEPKVNIEIGCAYLDYLLDMFSGDKTVALCAYNAGPNNVKKWLNNDEYSPDGKKISAIPYEETREYVKKVERREKIYRDLYGNKN